MRIAKWFNRQSFVVKAFIQSLITTIGFFFSAIIPNELVNSFQLIETHQRILAYLGVFLVVFIFYLLLYVIIKRSLDLIGKMENEEKELLHLAYSKCDRIVSDEVSIIDKEEDIQSLIIGSPLSRIQKIIDSIYEVFDEFYNKGTNPSNEIKFEVTFMTKSHKDGEITIPNYRNRENRRPTSMNLREKNIHIYDNTITAIIYREARPTIHIIEDTSIPECGYEELYPNQQKRIKSTIVFPIMSSNNLLVGTIVVHCDQSFFFRLERKKFWSELLEVFAKRIAYNKIFLDSICSKDNSVTLNISDYKNAF